LVVAALIAGCGADDTRSTSSHQSTGYAQSDVHKQNPTELVPPTDEQVESWPAAFCRAKVGMTRDDLARLMGPPSTDISLTQGRKDQTIPQMTWEDSVSGWHFTAFFDMHDRVKQLDVNPIGLSAQQKSQVTCGRSRR
jgi:hypothetical protein